MNSFDQFIESIHWINNIIHWINSLYQFTESIHWINNIIHWINSLYQFIESIHWVNSLNQLVKSIHWINSWNQFIESIHWINSLLYCNSLNTNRCPHDVSSHVTSNPSDMMLHVCDVTVLIHCRVRSQMEPLVDAQCLHAPAAPVCHSQVRSPRATKALCWVAQRRTSRRLYREGKSKLTPTSDSNNN